ncbi:glycine betaine/L-proline ABC transporter ATP-binding protein, partial [Tetragenococcus halophilus]
QKDTLVTDIFDMIYNSPAPLAVVDEEDRVVGVVVRGSVIGAMADTGEVEENKSEATNENETTEDEGVDVDA